jgi:hypothetical protein
MSRISTVLVLVALVATAACQDQEGALLGPQLDIAPSFAAMGGSTTYEVTVTNDTGGQPLTPPLAVTHRKSLKVFEVGKTASLGVREIAENGNLAPLAAALGGLEQVSDLVIAFRSPPPAAPPPVLPGESRTFTITADKGAKYFSFVSMLICTNDGFTGINSVRLPRRAGETVVYALMAYDAGSEINTEDFADIVPPCAPLTDVPSTDSGTGISNPALAEGGVIGVHAGILGIDDLVAIHEWTGTVATVSVTRLKSTKSDKSDKSKKSGKSK